ncbi:MAG TPA: OmpA family protein [Thermoanaerobaculia bacterium]|nr:OmpA family protein [Thermoanaerobaculia bacterium]
MRSKLRHTMAVGAVLLGLSMVAPAGAQSKTDQEMMKAQSELSMAESAVSSAEAAGAATLSKALYDESVMQIRQARAKWNDPKSDMREDAILRAVEARHAARAAEAHAWLVGMNTEIRNLRTDIGNFGGNAVTVSLYDPPMTFSRGVTSMDRVIVAENALKTAREMGGDLIAGADLKQAEETLKTARRLAKNQKQNESADHLAYIAEMQARRAEYLARRNSVTSHLASLRADRTRLAQQAVDNRARDEQNRRLEAERQAAELRQQLAAQSANREAEQAELERLRQQVAQTEVQLRTRLEEDRAARIAAEQGVDDLMRRYQAALVEGSATSIEAEQLRRQVEDQSLALRSLQERERLSETSMANQIDTLQRDLERERAEGRLTAEVLTQREEELNRQRADLQRLQSERAESERRRVEADNLRATAIAEAERRRNEAEAQTAQLRQQVAEQQQQVAAQKQEVAAQQARTTQTEAELARAREELAKRDAAATERITAMQTELSKLAKTRTSDRGFIVTLPGLFFDTGKAVLKPGARNTLSKIAEQLRMNPDARIEIEGHTDSVGSEQLNQTLSEKRAAAVRDYLASRGLPSVRISMVGLGESTPVASNDTAAGRQQNRRVELVIAPASQVSSQNP